MEISSVSFFRSSNFSMPWSGMRQQHLRVLLEHRGDHQGRDVLRHRVERLQRVGAHVELDPAGDQLQPVVHVRPARQDGDVEAVLAVGAVDQRLVEAAVLGLRHPVGGEGDLVERLGLARDRRQATSAAKACLLRARIESPVRCPPAQSRTVRAATIARANRGLANSANALNLSRAAATNGHTAAVHHHRRTLTIGVRSPPSPAPFDRPARFRPPPGGPPFFR